MKFLAFLTLLFSLLFVPLGATQAQDQPLMTRWAADVTPYNVLPEYPRPQLTRGKWQNLNGLWRYAITERNAEKPARFRDKILVPFPIESYLSRVQKRVTGKRLWYYHDLTVPDDWAGQRVILNFGAVDWEATVYINGQEIGTHQGGYDAFSFDITDALQKKDYQNLIVSVWDPTEGKQPRGKQVVAPGGIWYTPTTGIWQTVWIEPVPAAHITSIKIDTDVDKNQFTMKATYDGLPANSHYSLDVDVLDGGKNPIVSATSGANVTLHITMPKNAKLWSPDSPFLYDLRIRLKDGNTTIDSVGSYFGMRKIEMKKDDNGFPQIFLNNQPIFQYGLLDQGFWPEGIYTAPTDEALRSDIETTKKLGFNLIRKHVKVEPARWYYWADKLGMLVWQDMPSSGDRLMQPGEGEFQRNPVDAEQFEFELQRMVDSHSNSPSIVMWVLFNEGWGQYDTERLTDWLKSYDPSRLVDSASGWNDLRVGDVQDAHSYPGPDLPQWDYKRAMILGEFGGLGLPLEGHTWLAKDSWGYKQYTDVPSLLTDYSKLIKRLRYLKQERHLVAAIYTQTTDVETEVNGIMTYDRDVIKMGADDIRAVNDTLSAP
jgi:beta-galactosidase/beta-glucuronidase